MACYRQIACLLSLVAILSLHAAARGEVVVDNTAPAVVFSGTWPASTFYADYVGPNYQHSNRVSGLTATYTPDLPQAGVWRVEAYWHNAADRGLDVPYTVNYAGGSRTVYRSQSNTGGGWHGLGSFSFAAGTAGNAVLSSTVSNGAPVIADALRWTYIPSGLRLLEPASMTASASSEMFNGRDALAAISGEGMIDTDGDTLLDTHEANNYGDNINWMSDLLSADPDRWFKVGFDDLYELDHMRVWNFNATGGRTDRGIAAADIYFSTVASPSDNDFATNPEWQLLIASQSFDRAPGTSDYDNPQLIDLGGLSARWIALDILSTHGGAYAGLSEIQFFETNLAVPEPRTWTLLVTALFALIGRPWRRMCRR